MEKLTQFGRLLFILSFSMYVMLHIALPDVGVNDFVPKFLPAPYFWNYFTGACILAWMVSALIGKLDRLAALLMALYILIVIVFVHAPKAADNQMDMLNIFRNSNMIGGLLMYAAAFARDRRLAFGKSNQTKA